MTRAVLAALWSHWRRNPLQLFTLLAGLALATALWSGVQAINAEARASYDAAAATLGEGRFDQLTGAGDAAIPQATYIALRRAGWRVSPVVEGRIGGPDGSVRLIGIDPLTAPGTLGPIAVEADAIGDFLSGAGQIFGRAETLARLTDTGATLIEAPDAAPGTALTDIGFAQRLLGLEGQISRLIVAPDQPVRQTPLDQIADLRRIPAQGGSDIGRLTDSFHLNLTAFGLLSFAVGIFIVNGAIGLAFEQRRAVVRTLRALGVPFGRLIALMVVELLAFSLIAGGIGVTFGYLIAAALLPDVAATLRGLYGADVSGTLSLRPSWWLSGLVISVGGTALAASGALWRLARAPLLAAGQPRAWAMGAAGGRGVLGGVSAALLFSAAALAVWGSGLVAGFALLACLLIGAALALPLVLAGVLSLAARSARGPVTEWFWADTRQQLPGLSLALMALLLAMAANVGVSTMVSSFRLTFTGFLDQRLAAELYVHTADADEAAALVAFAAPRTRAILPLVSVNREVAGMPADIYAARDDATYRDNWRFLSTDGTPVWDAVFAGRATIVNEQLARRANLVPGDTVTLAPGLTLPIAGIFGDYGNPIGQVILGEELFAATFPGGVPTRFGLRLPSADVPALRRALTDDLGLPASAIIDQAALKAFSLEVFDRTFTVTTALNILTLAVAGFAILMSLLTLAALRVPQLAPVWALGMTRASLGRFELARAMLLAVLTAVCALPLGLGLAWVLLSVVNVEAFGWKLPMFLFPGDYLRLVGFALVAAALAALWPARRLARTPPSMLLKVFSNER